MDDAFKLNVTNLLAIMQAQQYSEDEAEKIVYFAFHKCVIGFLANLIELEELREIILEWNGKSLFSKIVPTLLQSILKECSIDEEKLATYQDIVHRVVYIADEFYQAEDEVNVFKYANSEKE